jgi:DNA-binding transcriptional LysR family regulator
MNVQMQQLRYFVAVADTRHFSRAAEETGVTQPSLSKQIQALETEVGASLFTRARGNVALTPAGEALLPHARRILSDADNARLEIAELVGLRGGRLRLGATPSLCTSLVAPVLRRYRDAYPGVRLHVEEGGSQDLVALLGRGALDVALIVLPAGGTDPQLTAEPILRESLVVARTAELPAEATMPLAALRDEPLIMFRTGYDLREATLEACRRAGYEPVFALEGGEMDAVLSFVEAGIGVAVVPSMVLSGRPRLHASALEQPGLSRTIALAHRRDVTPTHAARALRAVLHAHLTAAKAWNLLPGVEII